MSSEGSGADRQAAVGRILVVEDDPVLALSLEAALLDAGATEVVICPSLAATMEVLEQGAVDVIVLDVHLSDRNDGWALAELVSLLGPTPPRIVFSTGVPQEIPPQIAEMGPVFEKPYDPAQLAQAVTGRTRRGIFARLLG